MNDLLSKLSKDLNSMQDSGCHSQEKFRLKIMSETAVSV